MDAEHKDQDKDVYKRQLSKQSSGVLHFSLWVAVTAGGITFVYSLFTGLEIDAVLLGREVAAVWEMELF